jgi:beta-galactosidase
MRETVDFDKGWLFKKADAPREYPIYKGFAYTQAKTERCRMGPAYRKHVTEKNDFSYTSEHNGESWRTVDLPHDYVIEGIPDEKYNEGLGFLPYENAWYVKRFKLDECDKDKRITILFEGIATHATVYLNGCLMKRNFCGYTSFEVDISDVVNFDEENSLAVYVDTSEHEGWWYEGGGIYRHVKMIKTPKLSVDLWGIFAKPRLLDNGEWRVDTELTVRNDGNSDSEFSALGEIIDEGGKVIASAKLDSAAKMRDKCTVTFTFNVKNPLLYSPEEPNRYSMRCTVYKDGVELDRDEVKFGFRTFRIDPERGLFINGKHYKIKGVCGHADSGLFGKAVPDNINAYKVRLLKEMGANGYRTSHYPQSESLMEELDKSGFIVMDEIRWFESTDDGRAQLEMLMKRDRNRPSVFFWSLGNEEPYHITDMGRRICETLVADARRLDDSRAIMTAISNSPAEATVIGSCDVIGVNYNWGVYDKLHEMYPDKAIFAAECCATGTTRGWYREDDGNRAFISAYDHDTDSYFRGREFTWKFLNEHDWLLGGFQWIAFEHRGEATWPRLCSQSGAIDLFLQKKDAFYQNLSHWSDEPTVHILPHWSHDGFEGKPITVFAYTNLPRVELFLNGSSLGVREVEKFGHAEWVVPYERGCIEAVGYDEDGSRAASDKQVTPGKAYALKLTEDTEGVRANGKDFAIFTCTVIDEDGNELPEASPTVDFTATGIGRVFSTGSDITDHSSLFSPRRRMRAGKISVAVRISDKGGKMTLIAESDGLKRAVCEAEYPIK